MKHTIASSLSAYNTIVVTAHPPVHISRPRTPTDAHEELGDQDQAEHEQHSRSHVEVGRIDRRRERLQRLRAPRPPQQQGGRASATSTVGAAHGCSG